MSKFQPLFRRRSRKLGELNGFVEEIISGQQTIKLYNQEEAIISRFDEKPRSGGCLLQCRVLRQYDWSFHQLYQQSVVVLDQYVWRLAVFVRSSDIRNVSSFVLYSRKFSGPINELANIFSDLQSALAAAERTVCWMKNLKFLMFLELRIPRGVW